MPYPQFDRDKIDFSPLATRPNKVLIERDHISPTAAPGVLPADTAGKIADTVAAMRAARAAGRPVIMAFGAHTIKNGLGPVLIQLLKKGWVQHLATNGAGVIHDWEFAFQKESSEDVRANVARGKFGIWEETGFHINMAILLGAYDGLGYGESVGRLISSERHVIPSRKQLLADISQAGAGFAAALRAAGAADVLALVGKLGLDSGVMPVAHPGKEFSVQAAAYEAGIPFTSHPMFGHDIIYTHPANHGAAIGRAAERDFLAFARNIGELEGGVYLSIGSAVMSPMIFEKSLSMSRNVAIQNGESITHFTITVVDLAESRWDWSQGEPPMDSPDYYLRYCKTFNRMGGKMSYIQADNRDFLLHLAQAL
ncbi:MAG: hypothetical protein RRC34_11470 [Lentisphaeria bacterium]|nr:hypothetical protein [Lentisphaeria bacterium]